MPRILKTVILTKYDLIRHLRMSGIIVREYGIYPPYSLEYLENGDVRLDGLPQEADAIVPAEEA